MWGGPAFLQIGEMRAVLLSKKENPAAHMSFGVFLVPPMRNKSLRYY